MLVETHLNKNAVTGEKISGTRFVSVKKIQSTKIDAKTVVIVSTKDKKIIVM